MKNLLPLFFLVVAGLLHAAPTPDPAEEQIKAVMKNFLGAPGSSTAPGEARQILEYAEKTEAHEVEISPAYLPWMAGGDSSPQTHLLLVAFISGDILEQMKKGTSKPEPYSGILTALEAYEKLRLADITFDPQVVAAMKDLVALERAGQLKPHIDQIRATHSGTTAPSPAP